MAEFFVFLGDCVSEEYGGRRAPFGKVRSMEAGRSGRRLRKMVTRKLSIGEGGRGNLHRFSSPQVLPSPPQARSYTATNALAGYRLCHLSVFWLLRRKRWMFSGVICLSWWRLLGIESIVLGNQSGEIGNS